MNGKTQNDLHADGPPPDDAARGRGAPEAVPGAEAEEPSNTEAFDEEGAGIAPKE